MIQSASLFDHYHSARVQCQNDVELLALQKETLLPLIEQEKSAFIKAEYPRLQASMGNEYHIGNVRHVFHPLPESENPDIPVLGNPEELTLQELALLPTLEKCIPRLGTLSYMPLFRVHPDEQKRLNLLASLYEALTRETLCPETSVSDLLLGHEAFLSAKSPDNAQVIIKY